MTGPRTSSNPKGCSPRALVFRRQILLGFWLLAGVGILCRAVQLQVLQAAEWRTAAEEQHQTRGTVPAPRGAIVDRDGVGLAISHETFRVSVAPHELRDRETAAALLEDALELTGGDARAIATSDRRWVPIAGRFPPRVREVLGGVRGVYVERQLRRFYPHDDLGRGMLGAVIDARGSGGAELGAEERGAGGVEQEFEEHLRGQAGAEMLARDSGGRPIPGETWLVQPPKPGGSVVLSLDVALQEIASEALEGAVASTGARGGDLLVTDPHTGEVLAMVSTRDGQSTYLGGINTPYEPGSTLKPFTVATLLREGRASLVDSIDTGSGSWTTQRRTITDVSAVGKVTLARALQVSSNVGIAKAAARLSTDEQYEALRDFGFGVPTGIQLPGEVAGTLRRPSAWSAQSPASLAIGYEIAVTPIQMAMAYGALANGGRLMEPLLVRELRDGLGRTTQRFEPSAVRQVISPEIAREITRSLVDAVEDGTGTHARLASFSVAGKSGTSRAYAATGGYEPGAYFASFVGFFPAEDPQLVVFVKLEKPQGTYYGGSTAAPVTRATMEAILAAREPPLDRNALAAIARAQQIATLENDGALPASRVSLRLDEVARTGSTSPTARVLPDPPTQTDGQLSLPDMRGLSARVAARRLHALGLRVLWESAGPIARTIPAAGSPIAPGDSIRLVSVRPALGPDPVRRVGTRPDE